MKLHMDQANLLITRFHSQALLTGVNVNLLGRQTKLLASLCHMPRVVVSGIAMTCLLCEMFSFIDTLVIMTLWLPTVLDKRKMRYLSKMWLSVKGRYRSMTPGCAETVMRLLVLHTVNRDHWFQLKECGDILPN